MASSNRGPSSTSDRKSRVRSRPNTARWDLGPWAGWSNVARVLVSVATTGDVFKDEDLMTNMIEVQVPDDLGDLLDESASRTQQGLWADRVFALTRLFIGWTFLWAFLDKTFGLGFATEDADAWVNGGSPTNGFLSFATKGPLDGFYQSFAGDAWADWLFMIGLAGIGVALILGIGMRIAAASGALLLVLMWSAALAPDNNPFMDDHLIEAAVLVGLALIGAGDTWGFGKVWKKLPLVKRYPALI